MQRTNFSRSMINRHSYLAALALWVLAGCNTLWDSCLQCPDDEPNCAAEPLVDCPSIPLGWKNPTPQNSTIKGMWGSAPDNIWAVTETGTFIRFDGTRWTHIPNVTTPAEMTALSGSAANNIWAVGHRNTVMRYDGNCWSVVPVEPLVPLANLYGVWVSQDDVWAVGNGADDMSITFHILHFRRVSGNKKDGFSETGKEWNRVLSVSTNDGNPIRAVWGSSNADLWVVGDGGIIHHIEGEMVKPNDMIPSPTQYGLEGIWGIDRNQIWAVGQGGTIIKYNGTTWTTEASYPGKALHAIHGMDEGSMIAVGAYDTILIRSNGTWKQETNIPMGEQIDYHATWVGSLSGNRWAASSYGRIGFQASASASWTTMSSSAGN